MTESEIRHKLKSLQQALVLTRDVANNERVSVDRRALAESRLQTILDEIKGYEARLTQRNEA